MYCPIGLPLQVVRLVLKITDEVRFKDDDFAGGVHTARLSETVKPVNTLWHTPMYLIKKLLWVSR